MASSAKYTLSPLDTPSSKRKFKAFLPATANSRLETPSFNQRIKNQADVLNSYHASNDSRCGSSNSMKRNEQEPLHKIYLRNSSIDRFIAAPSTQRVSDDVAIENKQKSNY